MVTGRIGGGDADEERAQGGDASIMMPTRGKGNKDKPRHLRRTHVYILAIGTAVRVLLNGLSAVLSVRVCSCCEEVVC